MEDIRPFPTIRSFSSVIFAFFRVALGLLLLIRGISFIFHITNLQQMIQSSQFNFQSELLAYVISITHLFGGSLIVIGLLTRFALAIQVPILIAAVIFNLQRQVPGTTGELWLSVVVFILLIYFLVKGPGVFSMDAYRKNYKI